METFNKLVEWFVKNGGDRAIVALSGGVDSAVVALAAKKALGKGAIAITADYKTLAEEELAAAWRVAREIGIKHKVIEYNELENTSFVKNDTMRCYYCRIELGQHLAEEAKRADILLIVDGTNIDDLTDYRPGIRALRENGVRRQRYVKSQRVLSSLFMTSLPMHVLPPGYRQGARSHTKNYKGLRMQR
jgi:uncharacterized protein